MSTTRIKYFIKNCGNYRILLQGQPHEAWIDFKDLIEGIVALTKEKPKKRKSKSKCKLLIYGGCSEKCCKAKK